jgi:ANTAR domain
MQLRQQTEQVQVQAQAVQRITADARRQRRSSPAGRELLQRCEYARLLARLETMPVIEQAKGIIMARSRCGEAEAFDMLRRASQRSNVPVRDLAARIVAKTTETATPAARRASRRPAHRRF